MRQLRNRAAVLLVAWHVALLCFFVQQGAGEGSSDNASISDTAGIADVEASHEAAAMNASEAASDSDHRDPFANRSANASDENGSNASEGGSAPIVDEWPEYEWQAECKRGCQFPVEFGYRDSAPRLISTQAGLLGREGKAGDGGDAERAQLRMPMGVAIDPVSRRLYVADTGNHAVRVKDMASGKLSTTIGVLGSFGQMGHGYPRASTSTYLHSPRSVATVAGSRLLYMADTDNHVVRVMDPDARSSSIIAGVLRSPGRFGDGLQATEAQLNFPHDVTVDPEGDRLYIADTNNHAVRVVDFAEGSMRTLAGVLGSGGLAGDDGFASQSLMHYPYSVVVDVAGQQLFVSEPYNHVIRIVGLATGLLTTVAGTLGVPGKSGDGGNATDAKLHFPYGIDFDAMARQLYIADTNNHAIRIVDIQTNLIYTVAGTLGVPAFAAGLPNRASLAYLNRPTDVAVDPAPRILYVADSFNHAVRSVDLAARALVTVAGELGVQGNMGDEEDRVLMHFPWDVAVDEARQELYTADSGNRALRLTNLSTGVTTTLLAGGEEGDASTLLFPCSVAVDSSRQPAPVYVADAGHHAVFLVDPILGTRSTLAGGPESQDVALGLRGPCGLALGPGEASLYIADTGNHVVRLLDIGSGEMSIVAGVPGSMGRLGDDGPAQSAQLHSPSGLAFEASSSLQRPGPPQLYIADTENHAVRALDLSTGRLSTLAGVLGAGGRSGDGGRREEAQLYFPYGLALDSRSRQLFIADNWNHAVRLVDLATGLLTTIAGLQGDYGLRGDEGRANTAQLRFPIGLSLDVHSRRLYVADAGNHAARFVALSDEMRVDFNGFGLV